MLRAKVIAPLAIVATAAALLWLSRPSATPVPPSPRPEKTADSALERPAAGSREQHAADAAKPAEQPAPNEPKPSLDLALVPGSVVPPPAELDQRLPKGPRLDLDPQTPEPVRPFIAEDLRLFDNTRGARGVTRGYWVSDRMRLRGGIGYAEDDSSQDRELAIGIGVDVAF